MYTQCNIISPSRRRPERRPECPSKWRPGPALNICVYIYIYMFIYTYLSIYLSIYLSTSLSILYIYIYTHTYM